MSKCACGDETKKNLLVQFNSGSMPRAKADAYALELQERLSGVFPDVRVAVMPSDHSEAMCF